MKKDPKNNTVAICILLCGLVVSAAVYLWPDPSTKDGSTLVATRGVSKIDPTMHSPDAAARSSQGSTNSSLAAALQQKIVRDPFYHADLRRRVDAPPDAGTGSKTNRFAGANPLLPAFGIEPLSSHRQVAEIRNPSGLDGSSKTIQVLPLPNGGHPFVGPSETSAGKPTADVSSHSSAVEDPALSPVSGLRLSAIVKGQDQQVTAIIEGAGTLPMTLRVGDHVRGLRVASIYSREVVFSNAMGVWTLSFPFTSEENQAPSTMHKENADAFH